MTGMVAGARVNADEIPVITGRLRLVALLLATIGLGGGVAAALIASEPVLLLVGVAAGLGVTQLTGY